MAKSPLRFGSTFWHRAYQAALQEAKDNSGRRRIDFAVIVCTTELMEIIGQIERYPEYRAIATALHDLLILQALARKRRMSLSPSIRRL
jgi:hypothetical protein